MVHPMCLGEESICTMCLEVEGLLLIKVVSSYSLCPLGFKSLNVCYTCPSCFRLSNLSGYVKCKQWKGVDIFTSGM